MINLLMHLSKNCDNVQRLLREIVDDMWEDLNPRTKNNKYKKNSIVSSVNRLQSVVRGGGYIKKVGVEAAERHKNLSDYLASDDNLEKIIKAKPEQFDSIIEKVNTILHKGDLVSDDHLTEFGSMLLSDVFNYSAYRKKPHCFNRYKVLNFNEATCPYCNEGIIKIVRNEQKERGESRLLFDIDHFYPKHLYPYLALSFYNHIPSCKTCNQTYKGTKDFTVKTHIHPYQRCFDDSYTFTFNHGILLNEKIKEVKLKRRGDIEDLLCSDLELEARYEANVKLARLPKLVEILSTNSHLLNKGAAKEVELKLLLVRLSDFGIEFKKEEILSTPFSKVQRDIVKMFDINSIILE